MSQSKLISGFYGYILFFVMVLAMASKGYCIGENPNNDRISLLVSSERAVAAANNIPLRVMFSNSGSTDVRLLQLFDPFPVFFSLKITREDGTVVEQVDGGKVDIGEELKYITLKPAEAYSTLINLSSVLHAELDKGTYTLNFSYHNQYGENCFQNEISADTIKLTIVPQLQLSISLVNPIEKNQQTIPIRIGFENIGATPIRLLQQFEPVHIFFFIQLAKEDGTIVGDSRIGNSEFRKLLSVELLPNDQYFTTVDLMSIIDKGVNIEKGTYYLYVTYFNRYSDECFHDTIKSTIKIDVLT